MTTQSSMASFMKGAALLTLAGFFVKLLSAVYRVPFQNLVGDEGFYIYQQVYPFVAIFGIWTSYGFAVAVSKLLAEHPTTAQPAILRTAFWLIAGISAAAFVGLYAGAGFFAAQMGDPALSGLLRAGAFAVLFMAPLAIMKGRLQADGQMAPVASAQVAEQSVRVAVILIGSYAAVSYGLSLYAVGQVAIAAAGAGAFAAVLLLIRSYPKGNMRAASGGGFGGMAKKLFVTSLSVSMSSLLLVLFQLVDSFTVYRMLADQLGTMEAMEQKGIYDRAQPLVQFGILLATSLTLSLVPLIARAKTTGRRPELYASLAFRVSVLFAVAAAAGLTLVMPYVNEALFKTPDGSFALIIFNWQIISMSLVLVLTAILYGFGKIRVPAMLLFGGLMLKLIGNVLFVPEFGITGAAVAGNIGLAFIALALIWYFKKVWPLQFAHLRFYGWLTVAVMAMAIAVLGYEALIVPLVSAWPGRMGAVFITLTAVPLGGAVFLLAAAKSRLITEREWYIIPFGRRLAALQLAVNPRKKRS